MKENRRRWARSDPCPRILHGDHFGGCDRLLEKYGAIPVLMLKCPDWQLSLFTIFTLDQMGLVEYLERGAFSPKPGRDIQPFYRR